MGSWVKQHTDRLEHPKLLQVGPLAEHLDDRAIMWSNREMTDGFVPTAKVRTLVDWHGIFAADAKGKPKAVDPMALAAELVDAERWHAVDGGFEIHDYLEHQRSKEQILKDRAEGAARQKSYRDRRKGDAVTTEVRDVVTSDGSNTGSAARSTPTVTGALEKRGKSGEQQGQTVVAA